MYIINLESIISDALLLIGSDTCDLASIRSTNYPRGVQSVLEGPSKRLQPFPSQLRGPIEDGQEVRQASKIIVSKNCAL